MTTATTRDIPITREIDGFVFVLQSVHSESVKGLEKEIALLKAELAVERETVDKISGQSISEEEVEKKGFENYIDMDHRGAYEWAVELARETQAQRKVII